MARKKYGDQPRNWDDPFKLLGLESETCKIGLPFGPTNFRSTVLRPYFNEEDESPTERDELTNQNKTPQNEPQIVNPRRNVEKNDFLPLAKKLHRVSFF